MLIAALVFLVIVIAFWCLRHADIKKANGINECTASYDAALWTAFAAIFGLIDEFCG